MKTLSFLLAGSKLINLPRLSVLKDDGYNYLLGVFLEGHHPWYILLSLSFACNCSSCMWTNKGKRLNLKPGFLCLERRLADYHIDSCFRITFESSWELWCIFNLLILSSLKLSKNVLNFLDLPLPQKKARSPVKNRSNLSIPSNDFTSLKKYNYMQFALYRGNLMLKRTKH